MTLNHENMRSLIRNSTKPFVIKNALADWPSLNWPLSKWLNIFNNDKTLDWRCGENNCSKEPHWESKCDNKYFTPDEFISHTQDTSTSKWMYFDYKNIIHWRDRLEESNMKTPWDLLGFPEQGIDETTLWIGSKGAHTPCHMDTYGCNLVAQVIGRKQWILYPPPDPGIMDTQTRIPYEESSIYSSVNFQCGKQILDSLYIEDSEPCVIILDPGDILFVPHRWWHFVEHLTSGLSLNTWIPLHNIVESCAYIDEWLVQYLVKKFTRDLSKEEKSKLMNPNEMDLLDLLDEREELCLDQLKGLLFRHSSILSSHEDMKQNSTDTGHSDQPCSSTTKLLGQHSTNESSKKDSDISKNYSKYSNSEKFIIQEITPLTRDQFRIFCQQKCSCLQNVNVQLIESKKIDLDNMKNEEIAKCYKNEENGEIKFENENSNIMNCLNEGYGRENDSIADQKETLPVKLNQGSKRNSNDEDGLISDTMSKRIRTASEHKDNTILKNESCESNLFSSQSVEVNSPPNKTLTTNNIEDIKVNQTHLIKAFTHPEVISLVREKFLQQFQFDLAGNKSRQEQ